MRTHAIIGLVLAAAGACTLLLRQAVLAAQHDALQPTGPPPYLDTVGTLLLVSGASWFGVALLIRWRYPNS